MLCVVITVILAVVCLLLLLFQTLTDLSRPFLLPLLSSLCGEILLFQDPKQKSGALLLDIKFRFSCPVTKPPMDLHALVKIQALVSWGSLSASPVGLEDHAEVYRYNRPSVYLYFVFCAIQAQPKCVCMCVCGVCVHPCALQGDCQVPVWVVLTQNQICFWASSHDQSLLGLRSPCLF